MRVEENLSRRQRGQIRKVWMKREGRPFWGKYIHHKIPTCKMLKNRWEHYDFEVANYLLKI